MRIHKVGEWRFLMFSFNFSSDISSDFPIAFIALCLHNREQYDKAKTADDRKVFFNQWTKINSYGFPALTSGPMQEKAGQKIKDVKSDFLENCPEFSKIFEETKVFWNEATNAGKIRKINDLYQSWLIINDRRFKEETPEQGLYVSGS